MENLKVNKIFIVLLIVVMMLTISSKVFATQDLVNPIEIHTEKPDTSDQETTQTPDVQKPDTQTTTETKLPQTGDASDYAIFALVAVCIVVAIVAYKKVREYNNI